MNPKSFFIALLTVTTFMSCEPTLVKNTETKNNVMTSTTPEKLPSAITDKTWKITLINSDVITGEATDFYLKLNSSTGNFESKAGCNQITGEFKITKNQIAFSKIVTTKMLCYDTMKFENAYLALLKNPIDFVIIDASKFILKNDDIVVAQFKF
jgi:heat shock protein HslJ